MVSTKWKTFFPPIKLFDKAIDFDVRKTDAHTQMDIETQFF